MEKSREYLTIPFPNNLKEGVYNQNELQEISGSENAPPLHGKLKNIQVREL